MVITWFEKYSKKNAGTAKPENFRPEVTGYSGMFFYKYIKLHKLLSNVHIIQQDYNGSMKAEKCESKK